MRLGRVVTLGLWLSAAAAWMACVGDEPSTTSGAAPGSEGGACLANGGCDVGLTCLSDICVRVDGGNATDGATGSDSGGPGDAGADANSDACGLAIDFQVPDRIFCPFDGDAADRCAIVSDGGPSTACCAQPAGAACLSETSSCNTGTGTQWRCQRPSDCGGTKTQCCMMAVSEIDAGACAAAQAVASQTYCAVPGGCTFESNETLCATNMDCVEGGTCQPVAARFNGTSRETVVGWCK